MSVHDDTLLGLQQALDYFRGDKTKARSMIVEVPDDEIRFYGIYGKLSEQNKRKAMQYVTDLAMAANG